jgi:RNA polymerase sigma-70 factor (ECF subfamily)
LESIEQDWLNKALKGDPDAFTVIIERFSTPVYNLCYRMLGCSQDAEDASQETFIRAYQSLGSYDTSRSFGTWLLAIAAHYCIDQIRRRRYPTIAIEDLPVPDLPDKDLDVESKLLIREERGRIRRIISQLEPTDRAAVVLYYWNDLSYDEISNTLGLTNSAVKSRLHRTRRAMATEWMKTQPDEMIRERRWNESPTV